MTNGESTTVQSEPTRDAQRMAVLSDTMGGPESSPHDDTWHFETDPTNVRYSNVKHYADALLAKDYTPAPDAPYVELENAQHHMVFPWSHIWDMHSADEAGVSVVWGTYLLNDKWVNGKGVLVVGTPFDIWEDCHENNIECPEPPSVTFTSGLGVQWQYIAVTKIIPRVNDYMLSGWARFGDHDYSYGVKHIAVAKNIDTIRDLCDREGVPYPTYEPEIVVERDPSIVVARSDGGVLLDTITRLTATIHDNKPSLLIEGTRGDHTERFFTTTPISSIVGQAADMDIDLPKVTVETYYGDENEWKSISATKCYYGDSDKLLYSVKDGDGMWCAMTETPAQVIALCALAGWDEPECVCVFTTPSGKPLELKPNDIRDVSWRLCQESTYLELRNMNPQERYIRELVPQARAMMASFDLDVE